MAGKVADFQMMIKGDDLATAVWTLWDKYDKQRAGKVSDWQEVRDYVFATDTTKTSNKSLPWKNSTTLPKLCQIRDNLHSNYIAALFSNDDWLKWEGYTLSDELKEKRENIEAYMKNKTRTPAFRNIISQLLYDYIDYGNAIATATWVNETKVDPETGEVIPGFIGPKPIRISPYDVVFNPTAAEFGGTYKIIRSIKTLGELQLEAVETENVYLAKALKEHQDIASNMGQYSSEDARKASGYALDGFGDLKEYYGSTYVEVLEFWGDLLSPSGELLKDHVITVIDRRRVIRKQEWPSWFSQPPIYHAGWRLRPDNLWAMGPLDNLVGMQYRIDHLENAKADAVDLAIHPPLKIIGNVEEFEWHPGCEVHIDEGGDVQEVLRNQAWVAQANQDIGLLEMRMEEFAGAPKQAMGIRTPGEKTAFEVQQLQNAAGRIFQEKITNFEINVLEPLLNYMLELAKRNLDVMDTVRVSDTELGVEVFVSITKEEITSQGKLRPVGARHFSAQSKIIQDLTGLANTNLWAKVEPHVSGKNTAKLIEDTFGLQRFEIFSPNISIFEQQELQQLANQAQQTLEEEAVTPVDEGMV